jgi:hypothetical protein
LTLVGTVPPATLRATPKGQRWRSASRIGVLGERLASGGTAGAAIAQPSGSLSADHVGLHSQALLLMIPTLFGVLLTFVVIQFVPGGPVDRYLAGCRCWDYRAEGSSVLRCAGGVDQRLERIKALYGFDKPALTFLQMLVVRAPSIWARLSRTGGL